MIPVHAIQTFFQASTRNGNDAANKVRENVLNLIGNQVPTTFLQDAEHGSKWQTVLTQWQTALHTVAAKTSIGSYTCTAIEIKGGRSYNYDALVRFYNGESVIATRKIEFKHGGTNISALPQFLSLQAKVGLFAETYDSFWYDHYLDEYLRCDEGLVVEKPDRATYLARVTSTNYEVLPFFSALKQREHTQQAKKNAVVNRSITDYLEKHGATINAALFSDKVRDTQTDKIYLLWSNGMFHIDGLDAGEMTGLTFRSIRKGNVLELISATGKTIYEMLLRWRNHKGILNPAWQISMKRV